MTLFESESQYREKATIWRVFSLLPLYAALAEGHIWKWFAINIPMNLIELRTDKKFTSDIDILACLYNAPCSKELIYKSWEVKVSLLCKNGTAHSLKSGKIKRTINQLKAYRKFGFPDVSLLDIYLCEAGFMEGNSFPPPSLKDSISKKIHELSSNRFGYQLLPFGHYKVGDDDFGLFAIHNIANPIQTTINVLPTFVTQPKEPFFNLTAHLNEFFEQAGDQPDKYLKQIVYCRNCCQLQLINMRETYTCPECQSDLIAQS